ncbi:hypothetical protein ASPSYDRAFT_51233 [Aspergillus sydowii CBS 593.65]|uniref:Uncharacterized protein n=1 Tax=Aspergillus sydowii CBS 593.65 TaxID=1036612 RepID=A0A1L9T142_9EURO|nr:uncharacterized protein ASPSYDRAFT_51233 [Aspergillus sydowii CBS 593.65]OJJ53127.1 hypothetical protein ASPSYDRAFT_51233 [Aspergillus sydowii CBS 593.65]
MTKKPLGRSTGSLNAPIAAFTMAVVLCSYCIYSINSARMGAHSGSESGSLASSSTSVQKRQRQDEWVKRVLEEKGRKG